MSKRKVAILISGRGSNMMALLDAMRDVRYPAEVACVIANDPRAKGILLAEKLGILTFIIDHKQYPSREAFEDVLHTTLLEAYTDIVCLAGFMRLLSPSFVDKWRGKIINIHPSLLPKYKGLDTHRRVLEAGDRETGCTVHHVVPEMDAGPVIMQATVPVLADDTPETLGARVLKEEHRTYPEALKRLIQAMPFGRG
jgi:phosphoribosylglycinamide formyltransferase-1